MGSGEKSLRNFHLHLPHLHHHHHKKQARDVPKGCLAIKVGQGEEQQRFVVPVIYFNHPLFIQLLKEAEEEYGFDQKGTITIPCHVEEFRCVQGMIDREKSIHHHHHVGYLHVWLMRKFDDDKDDVMMTTKRCISAWLVVASAAAAWTALIWLGEESRKSQ
ncbi:unnamed protein product [Dovyalis caffra]|uniref:Uncharacterized protein n=1 Tax=Dovyalis caffra TaxID=77055 RepID=A0AAV1SB12_9ROSI|nr:unnamed protein product [Dovyalis caffra]